MTVFSLGPRVFFGSFGMENQDHHALAPDAPCFNEMIEHAEAYDYDIEPVQSEYCQCIYGFFVVPSGCCVVF